jgi:hypothetical protein
VWLHRKFDKVLLILGFGFVSLIVIVLALWLAYFLFIRGQMWSIGLILFASFGGKYLLEKYFPSLTKTALTFISTDISWAALLAFIIVLFGINHLLRHD